MSDTLALARQSFDPRVLGAMHLWLSGEINGNAGNTWSDLSGSGNDGMLTNGPTFSTTGGGAISFDGVNDYVLVSGVTNVVMAAPWTIALWFRPTGAQSTKGIFALDGSLASGGPSVLFQRQDSSNVRWYLNGSYRITHSVSDNTFYHVALTYDGTIYRSYLNGAAGNTYTGGITSGSRKLYIAAGFNGYFNGVIGEFAIWSSALSADQVSAAYQRTRFRYA